MYSHRMLVRWLDEKGVHSEITDITDVGQNPDTSRIFMVFPRFESDKPLQTFSASTTLHARRSVRCLGLHSQRNSRKTTKIKQNPLKNQLEIDTKACLCLNRESVLHSVHRSYPDHNP